MRRLAFSMVELLMVVAIIGILAAIAMPSYRLYQAKVIISKSYQALDFMAQQAKVIHSSKGVFPTSVTFNGLNVPRNAWTTVNFGNISQVSYGAASDDQGVIFQGSLTGLSAIPGHVAGVTSYTIQIALRNVNGTIRQVCGMWASADTPSIPILYQPAGCSCSTTSSFASTGTGC